ESILTAIARNPACRVSQLPLLTEVESRQILEAFNDTTSEYPRDEAIHEIFQRQAAGTPEAIAVEFGTDCLSYRELNERSNQLAHQLRAVGVAKDQPVGLCLRPSANWVLGMLGVLKAGGAYVPLDADYPVERLAFMIGDTRPTVVLTEQFLLSRMPASDARLICLDSDWDSISRQPTANLPAAADGRSLAYVMFTSGSTGQPKGVMVPHRAVNRLVLKTNYI